jgi:cell division septation protein DedD
MIGGVGNLTTASGTQPVNIMADEQISSNRATSSPERTPQPQQQNDPLAELARLIGQNDPFAEPERASTVAARQNTTETSAGGRQPQAVPSQAMPSQAWPQNEARESRFDPALQKERDPLEFIRAAHEQAPHPMAGYRDAADNPQAGAPYHDFEEHRPSRGLRTVGAVVVLVLIGTVAAFGYRLIFGASSTNAPPPVIRANPEPTKVPPPAAGTEAQGKSAYDRVGERAQGERLVSREEKPVNLKEVVRPGADRVPSSQNQPPQSATAGGMPGETAAPSALGEPKKVRTVTIKPNAGDANSAPAALTPSAAAVAPVAPLSPPKSPPQPQAQPSTPPSRQTPTQLSAPVRQDPPQQQAQTPARPQIERSQNERPQVETPGHSLAPSANAPLTLNEDSVLTLPRSLNEPRAATPQRQAPAQTPAAAAASQKQAAVAPAPPPARQVEQSSLRSGYLVQVSSQRSEADAQSALRNLQAKFPNILGNQPTTIRRAELGDRGVFYRAMIGPFANREQAVQLCGSLKAAGGDCIVQGN